MQENNNMKNTFYLLISGLLVLAACSDKSSIESKKAELSTLRTEYKEMKDKIAALEKELSEIDSTYDDGAERNAALVTSIPAKPSRFVHTIEVRGTIASRTNVSMSAEMGGTVEEIKVREGDYVREGDVLIRLNTSLVANQIKEVKTAMELANVVYERQKNLWEQNIGTEIQYLQAKNNYETLESRLGQLNAQYGKMVIKAPFNGVVDEVLTKEGQMAAPGYPLIRVVNPGDGYITADISEAYVGQLKKGDSVKIYVPSLDKEYGSTITAVGQSIKLANRTFMLEAKLPAAAKDLKPNMLVVLHLADYVNENAISVPTRIVLEDLKGHYVYLAQKRDDDYIAQKRYVNLGKSDRNTTEIVSGLQEGDVVIDRGSMLVAQGALIKIQ